MMLLEPNRDQIEIFVQALFRYVGKDGFISMRAFYESDDSDKPVRITPTSLAGGLGFVILRRLPLGGGDGAADQVAEVVGHLVIADRSVFASISIDRNALPHPFVRIEDLLI